MKHEFKIKKSKDQTVYTLESASVGASSTAGGATVTKTLGGVRRRDNLLAQEGDSIKVPVKQKPRQGPLRPQTGAGAHKDKKKAQKQGQEKHRKPYMEELKDKIESLKSQLEENDLAQQMLALAKSKGMNARIAGTPDQERERTQQMMAQRAKERDAASAQAASDDAKNLPQLKAEYEEMKKKYEALGGSNWQYADREQNLSSAEREARSMEPALRNLSAKIVRAEKAGVAEGLPQTLRKIVPGYAKREIDKKMDAGKFGKTDADKDANFQRYKKIQDKLKEFAPPDSGDDRNYEYEVYQCNPNDQFDWIGGPIYKSDDMGKVHSIAYNLHKKHPDKAFMIWQERSQGSRGGYGIKDDEQGVAEEAENKDMTGQTCEKCKKGKYQERSQHDDMQGKVTCKCGHRVDRWKKYKESGVAEGAEFGAYYYEQLAQQVFDTNPNLTDENEILNLGYKIAKGELGSRAQGMFRDEDFPSDFVSAYSYLQKQGVAEGSNPEYDDEAGMADNNLETLKRAVVGLDELINAGDNLPEWCQEKIAVAKSMLVAVWDYMQSEEHSEQGLEEDEEAMRAFLAKGGKIQVGKTHPPRKAEKWQGSAHIGAAGGRGSKGSVSGMAANTNPKGGKPVVSTESRDICNVCGQTPCNCTTISEYESKLKEMLDLKLAEKIPPNASVDYYIQDFSKSNAPQFRGKTKEKRKQMAIAAYYGSKQPKKKKK